MIDKIQEEFPWAIVQKKLGFLFYNFRRFCLKVGFFKFGAQGLSKKEKALANKNSGTRAKKNCARQTLLSSTEPYRYRKVWRLVAGAEPCTVCCRACNGEKLALQYSPKSPKRAFWTWRTCTLAVACRSPLYVFANKCVPATCPDYPPSNEGVGIQRAPPWEQGCSKHPSAAFACAILARKVACPRSKPSDTRQRLYR